jgi:hypothetical protein
MPKDVQAGRQEDKQADRQARKSGRQKDRQAATMVSLSIIRIQYIYLLMPAYVYAGRQEDIRQTGRQTQAGREVRQAERQAGSNHGQPVKQTYTVRTFNNGKNTHIHFCGLFLSNVREKGKGCGLKCKRF